MSVLSVARFLNLKKFSNEENDKGRDEAAGAPLLGVSKRGKSGVREGEFVRGCADSPMMSEPGRDPQAPPARRADVPRQMSAFSRA